jgi:hypothetical protein
MPSPFPGMNPYLEQDSVWHDFHERFSPAVAELLTPQVRPNYVARIDKHVYIRERLGFVEIRDRQDRRLITVLELLSPTNKLAGPDREHYLAKRGQLLASGTHFVEIDLLRGGPRLPLEDLPQCDYYVLVSRAEERPQAGLWPLRLRDRLPVIPIPLRSPHPDAQLDLQALLNRIYDAAGYEDDIYTGEPQPRLTPEDAAWAGQFLNSQP